MRSELCCNLLFDRAPLGRPNLQAALRAGAHVNLNEKDLDYHNKQDWPAALKFAGSASAALRSASAGFRLDSTQPCSRFSINTSIIRARSLLNPRATCRYRGFLGFYVGALRKGRGDLSRAKVFEDH